MNLSNGSAESVWIKDFCQKIHILQSECNENNILIKFLVDLLNEPSGIGAYIYTAPSTDFNPNVVNVKSKN